MFATAVLQFAKKVKAYPRGFDVTINKGSIILAKALKEHGDMPVQEVWKHVEPSGFFAAKRQMKIVLQKMKQREHLRAYRGPQSEQPPPAASGGKKKKSSLPSFHFSILPNGLSLLDRPEDEVVEELDSLDDIPVSHPNNRKSYQRDPRDRESSRRYNDFDSGDEWSRGPPKVGRRLARFDRGEDEWRGGGNEEPEWEQEGRGPALERRTSGFPGNLRSGERRGWSSDDERGRIGGHYPKRVGQPVEEERSWGRERGWGEDEGRRVSAYGGRSGDQWATPGRGGNHERPRVREGGLDNEWENRVPTSTFPRGYGEQERRQSSPRGDREDRVPSTFQRSNVEQERRQSAPLGDREERVPSTFQRSNGWEQERRQSAPWKEREDRVPVPSTFQRSYGDQERRQPFPRGDREGRVPSPSFQRSYGDQDRGQAPSGVEGRRVPREAEDRSDSDSVGRIGWRDQRGDGELNEGESPAVGGRRRSRSLPPAVQRW